MLQLQRHKGFQNEHWNNIGFSGYKEKDESGQVSDYEGGA